MKFSEKLIAKAINSKTTHFLDTVRTGWNSYSFIFYIGGISAILGGIFGLSGWLSIIVILFFFYFAGRLIQRLEAERSAARKKKHTRQ